VKLKNKNMSFINTNLIGMDYSVAAKVAARLTLLSGRMRTENTTTPICGTGITAMRIIE